MFFFTCEIFFKLNLKKIVVVITTLILFTCFKMDSELLKLGDFIKLKFLYRFTCLGAGSNGACGAGGAKNMKNGDEV